MERFCAACFCVSAAVADIVKNPYGVESDSFYFVDGQLIMHNKARYRLERGGYVGPVVPGNSSRCCRFPLPSP